MQWAATYLYMQRLLDLLPYQCSALLEILPHSQST